MNTRTGMASWKKIQEHWSHELGFDLPDNRCWFCHLEMQRKPDRAHIKSLVDGGANTANNLLLTCSHCNGFVDAVCMHSGEGGVLEWLIRCHQAGNAEIPPLPEVMAAIDKLTESMPREVALIIAHRAWIDRSRQKMEQEFVELEKSTIASRTKAAIAAKKARGERVGGVPLGSVVAKDGRRLEAHAAEQEALQLIRELRSAGLSMRAIVARLNASGVPCRGAQWHLATIKRVLSRQEAMR